MFDSFLSLLRHFVLHPIILFVLYIATVIGGVAAVDYFFPDWTSLFTGSIIFLSLLIVLDYFWQTQKVQTGKMTVNKSLFCRLFPRFCFRKAYLRHVSFEHRVFNIKGLRTRGTYTIELEHVFVELRIAPAVNPNQPNSTLVGVKELQGNQPIWQFLQYAKRRKEPLRIAIIGAPGSGKTTLLQHIAIILAVRKAKQFGVKFLNSQVPLLLALRQHTQAILEKKLLAEIAQTHFSGRYPDLSPPEGWFTQQLQAGNCLVLLDGLDEVAEASQRKQVSNWIDEQIVKYSRCHFIITSRPYGYQEAPLYQVNVLEVQPFNQSQVGQFIDAWYLANEVMSFGGKRDAGVVLKAQQEAKDLRGRLQQRPVLTELTVNPLLLTMIAMVHRYRGQLPGRRVELYAEICDVLLGHWREAKGIQEKLTAAQKRVALQPLAAEMMETQVRELSTVKAMAIIQAPLQNVGLAESEVSRFLEEMQAGSGLLLERERGVWSFAHLTFQEYLATAHYVQQKLHGNWWRSRVAQSWWQETLRLYAAQTDATPIVRACLKEGSVLALTLAVDCLEEALELDKNVRAEVEQRLIAGLEAEDKEQRKLAAEVKLKQRLKRLQRLDERREIDLHFISCAEYQLFLDEKRAAGEFYQPDHWLEYQFSKGEASRPIVGVRAEDAVAFCEWLSQKEGGRYRLPTKEEAQENGALEDRQVATWCQVEEGGYDLQWSSQDKQRDIELRLHGLLKQPIVERWMTVGDFIYISFRIIPDIVRDIRRALRIARAQFFAATLLLFYISLVTFAFAIFIFSHSVVLFSTVVLVPVILAVLAFTHYFVPKTPDITHDLNRDTNHIRGQALDRALALARKMDDEVLYQAMERKDFQVAQQRLQQISVRSSYIEKRIDLLTNLLTVLMATTTLQQQLAWQQYNLGLIDGSLNDIDRLMTFYIRWLKRETSYHKEKRTLSNLYRWLQIVIAREEGKLPAWEGIRVVREREE
jgi:energy-coupling factor transporter ATP-binding protein EcfA2